MVTMIVKRALGSHWRAFLRDQAGNTLAMIAGALIPLLAMAGGGIDMGRSYLAQSRLQQACDAGVLAARKKLGSAVTAGEIPSDVGTIGNKFFNINFRSGAYGSKDRSFAMTLESDYSVSGKASVNVPTTVMAMFGYTQVPINVECAAKLSFSNTDIMFVLDTTGSMASRAAPSDTLTKIDTLKDVVRNFHTKLEASKASGTRIRYGFVPYSTNVNVGALLENGWVTNQWTYQSREAVPSNKIGTSTTYSGWTFVSGGHTYNQFVSSYTASGTAETGYKCNVSPPGGDFTYAETKLSETSSAYAGPPSGTQTVTKYQAVYNGSYYWQSRSGSTCTIYKDTYNNETWQFTRTVTPSSTNASNYRYAPIQVSAANWRTQSNGCIEERATYEIDDYANVDFNRALDLNLDLVPQASNADTQWHPQFPDIIYEREIRSGGYGSFNLNEVIEDDTFFAPGPNGYAACPAAAQKLAEMSSASLNTYLNTLQAAGSTYHDIGMIWGGRLLSPTGLFATENADLDGKSTSRHLIFLTDGETSTLDISYSSYGVEPLDRRRWNPTSPKLGLSLNKVVENRLAVACSEVKKRNITVWVVGFGTTLNQVLTECAGPGHYFEAANSAELSTVFSNIASQLGDLRVSK